MSSPKIAITTYIASSPDQVWRALTDPDITERYWGNTRIESDWKVGSKIIYRRNGEITDEHTVIASEPPRHLVHTFHPVSASFNPSRPRESPWTSLPRAKP